MKSTVSVFVVCLSILLSSYAFSACGGGGSCGSCGSGGEDSSSDSVTSDCNCADLSCPDRYLNNCMSRSRCCEAFGNIGSLDDGSFF